MTEPETNVNHLEDVYDEVRSHFLGRNKFMDMVLPPVVFMLVNYFWSLQPALWSAVGVAVILAVMRVIKGDKLIFAIGGLAAVFAAALLAWWFSRAESFFLPSIIVNGLVVFGFSISLVLRKPLIALASYFSRDWPLAWYWHPRIRPAYMEVTAAWVIIMAARLIIQVFLYQNNHVNVLGVFQILTGTPSTIILLVLSYLYGVWRLRSLKGPSVSEFTNGEPPPWQGQRKGF